MTKKLLLPLLVLGLIFFVRCSKDLTDAEFDLFSEPDVKEDLWLNQQIIYHIRQLQLTAFELLLSQDQVLLFHTRNILNKNIRTEGAENPDKE